MEVFLVKKQNQECRKYWTKKDIILVLSLVVGSEREVLVVFSEEDGVTYVCLRCVVSLLSVVSTLARLWGIKGGWRSKMAIVERYFWNKVFICSMEYWVCFWCCKTHEELWVLRRNWVMRCWEGWDGRMCRRTCEGLCSLHFDKRHVAVVGIELWMSPWVLCLVFGESMRYLH